MTTAEKQYRFTVSKFGVGLTLTWVFNVALAWEGPTPWLMVFYLPIVALNGLNNFRSFYVILYRMRWLGYPRLCYQIGYKMEGEFPRDVYAARKAISASDVPFWEEIALERSLRRQFGFAHIEIGQRSYDDMKMMIWFRSDADAVAFRMRYDDEPQRFD